jgi:putative effector of murein hydrolase
MTDLTEVWVYLSASPLLFLTLTLAAFQAGSWVYERSGHKPFLNPVMTAVVLLVAILTLTQTPYPVYFEGAQFVHFLLGPATVALAIPLYRQFERVRRSALAMVVQASSAAR